MACVWRGEVERATVRLDILAQHTNEPNVTEVHEVLWGVHDSQRYIRS